ncbi:hypothetical protein BN1708_016728 [Verticillium longisporum]|uniref:Formylmethionine deformylase-like protein n=1 Tax=Verticillium longisporum TaxID=100787 RepID=A0A0G4MZJ7_VERLO|nr:hypothetical protein BN1708_016728 [Verticillium longisporum]
MDDDAFGIRHNQPAAIHMTPISQRSSVQRKPVGSGSRTSSFSVSGTSATFSPGVPGQVSRHERRVSSPLAPNPRTSATGTGIVSPQSTIDETSAFSNYFASNLPAAHRPQPSPIQVEHDFTYSNYQSYYEPSTANTTLGYHSSSALLLNRNRTHGEEPVSKPLASSTVNQVSSSDQQRRDQPPAPPSAGSGPLGDDGSPPPYSFSYWRPSYNMYFFLWLGICAAMGHHFFYNSLDGRIADNHIHMLRYGTALSFVAKASLAASVVLAFKQRVWLTVRRKAMTLSAVDSLFAAADDLSAIFNAEIFRQARVAIILAIYVWCTPLVVILTSETLAVRNELAVENATCPAVRTLNFAAEETNEWRDAKRIDKLISLSVSLWNTTRGALDEDGNEFEGWYDYFTSPSWQFEQVATLAAFSKTPVARAGAAEEICGTGWNCTYTVQFTGPGYKCTELASGVGSKPKKLGNATAPFGTEILAPEGNQTYVAQAFLGHYSETQMEDVWPGGIPTTPAPFPKYLGALRTEPILWIGYSDVDDPTELQPDNRSDPEWDKVYTPKISGCEHYETKYEVLFNYTGLLQYTNVTRRDFLHPVVDTTFLPDEPANDGTMDNTTAVPESNYILPSDTRRYRRAMAYHSIGMQLRTFINGSITEPGKIANTRALQTRLLDPTNWLGVRDMQGAVQGFYEDILLSMLSNPQFLAVAWAAEPEVVSGVSAGGENTMFPCTRSRNDNRYRYVAWELWAVYAAAIALAIIGVGFGTVAIWEEGLWRNTRFSSIVAATRGPWLEKVPWTGDGPVEGEAKRVKVGYGLVSPNRGEDGLAEDEGRFEGRPMSRTWDAGDVGSPRGPNRVSTVGGTGDGSARDRFAFGLEGDVRQDRGAEREAEEGGGGSLGRSPKLPFRRTWQRVDQA